MNIDLLLYSTSSYSSLMYIYIQENRKKQEAAIAR